MTNRFNELWVEKYRPTDLKNYVFENASHEASFKAFIKAKSIPHLLLSGMQGSGKSTIAQILIKKLGIDPIDVLYLNASDSNSIDDMRHMIKNFVMSYAYGNSATKVVLLEEGDYITHNAQGVLRRLMEDYSDDARFIITANHANKIIPAIKSRCQHFIFKAADRTDIASYVAKILIKEDVKFELDALDLYVSAGYPDIRKIVNSVQQHVVKGALMNVSNMENDTDDYNISLMTHIANDDWLGARKVLCDNVPNEEMESIFRFLYLNIHKSKKFADQDNWEFAQIEIAEHLWMHSLVADPEINLSALFIKLKNI